MKALFVQLASYHNWANDQLFGVMEKLPQAQHTQEVISSFSSLLKTVLHMWDAESIWWQRVKLQERIHRPSEAFGGTMQDAIQGLRQQGLQWKEWILESQERMLDHEFIYYNSNKEPFKQPVHQVLFHIFNHGTYHRGQLVTILRQLGVEKIPQTDFIVFSRKKGA